MLAGRRREDVVARTRLCLQFGRAVQTNSLMAGEIGYTFIADCARGLGRHLGRLTGAELTGLVEVIREHLRQPDTLPRVLTAEHRGVRASAEEVAALVRQGDLQRLKQLLNLSDRELAQATGFLALADPDLLLDQMLDRVDDVFERQALELTRPAWSRSLVRKPSLEAVTSVDGWLCWALAPDVGAVVEEYTRTEALVRLLGCHCAIRAWQLKHRR